MSVCLAIVRISFPRESVYRAAAQKRHAAMDTTTRKVFSMLSVPRYFKQDSGASSVEWSEVSWWGVRELLQFSHCELLLLEADSWGTGLVREPRVRGTSVVGSRYQTTTGEDRLRKLSACCNELQSVLISDSAIATSCKWPINLTSNSYPVYSHSYT
jgi:hypothetical protein